MRWPWLPEMRGNLRDRPRFTQFDRVADIEAGNRGLSPFCFRFVFLFALLSDHFKAGLVLRRKGQESSCVFNVVKLACVLWFETDQEGSFLGGGLTKELSRPAHLLIAYAPYLDKADGGTCCSTILHIFFTHIPKSFPVCSFSMRSCPKRSRSSLKNDNRFSNGGVFLAS